MSPLPSHPLIPEQVKCNIDFRFRVVVDINLEDLEIEDEVLGKCCARRLSLQMKGEDHSQHYMEW